MKIEYRLAAYLAAFIGLTVYVTWSMIAESKAMLPKDPSAMAWVGFLPFMIPIFMLQAAIYVGPVAAVVEIALAIWRWWK